MADKIIHRAKNIRDDGAVSALCFARMRPIDLARASWTLRDDAVTCQRCRELMREIERAVARTRKAGDQMTTDEPATTWQSARRR